MTYYAVETSKSGYTQGTRMKNFGQLKAAERYAKTQHQKGYAIALNKVTRNTQSSLMQRGWKAEGSKKIHKHIAADFGTFKYKHSEKMPRKMRKESGFGLGLFR